MCQDKHLFLLQNSAKGHEHIRHIPTEFTLPSGVEGQAVLQRRALRRAEGFLANLLYVLPKDILRSFTWPECEDAISYELWENLIEIQTRLQRLHIPRLPRTCSTFGLTRTSKLLEKNQEISEVDLLLEGWSDVALARTLLSQKQQLIELSIKGNIWYPENDSAPLANPYLPRGLFQDWTSDSTRAPLYIVDLRLEGVDLHNGTNSCAKGIDLKSLQSLYIKDCKGTPTLLKCMMSAAAPLLHLKRFVWKDIAAIDSTSDQFRQFLFCIEGLKILHLQLQGIIPTNWGGDFSAVLKHAATLNYLFYLVCGEAGQESGLSLPLLKQISRYCRELRQLSFRPVLNPTADRRSRGNFANNIPLGIVEALTIATTLPKLEVLNCICWRNNIRGINHREEAEFIAQILFRSWEEPRRRSQSLAIIAFGLPERFPQRQPEEQSLAFQQHIYTKGVLKNALGARSTVAVHTDLDTAGKDARCDILSKQVPALKDVVRN